MQNKIIKPFCEGKRQCRQVHEQFGPIENVVKTDIQCAALLGQTILHKDIFQVQLIFDLKCSCTIG
jgi:hypothetical protein